MKINKLIVRGPAYQRTIEFSDSLNIISGEKTSGKSLILSLIDYCLGKTKIHLNVQFELKKYVDTIFLEVKFGDDIYTISRGLKKEVNNFYVYYCPYLDIDKFMPEKMLRKNLFEFLMDKLNIVEFKRKKSKRKSEEITIETVSFRDIMRYSYIRQHDLGTDNFLKNNDSNVRYKNPIAFEMIFDLVNESQNDVQQRIVETKNLIVQTTKRRDGLMEYLIQKGNNNFTELLKEIKVSEHQIEIHNEKKFRLLSKQEAMIKENTANSDFVRLLCQESGHKSTNKFDFQFKLLNLIFGGRSFSPVQILKTL